MIILVFIFIAGASGSPHFIARQARTTKGVTVEQRNRWREQCQAACGPGVDSSCSPQCEAEMFTCQDHDLPKESQKLADCEAGVLARYKDFGKEWNATHFVLTHGGRNIAAATKEFGPLCQAACGESADSSCVPQCETELYACVDHNSVEQANARESCKQDVLNRYKEFVSNWDATHFFQKRLSAERAAVRGQCQAICGSSVDSDCAIKCEVEMYACLDHNSIEEADARQKCMADVAAKFGNYGELHGALTASASFMARRVSPAAPDDDGDMDSHALCAHLCTDHAGMEPEDSYCTTDCRAAMYRCVSLGSKDLRSTCRSEVEAKYTPAAAPGPAPAAASPAAASPAAVSSAAAE